MRGIRARLSIALMLLIIAAGVIWVLPRSGSHRSTSFDHAFVHKTMRVDYYHTGNVDTEIISIDRVVSDGGWAGSVIKLIDDTNLGKYRFEVFDTVTGEMIYSRGFASIYGEWETTAEAKEVNRTFHESLRFPWPQAPVRIVLKKRNELNEFIEFASFEIDPEARSVNPADLAPIGEVWTLFENGPPGEKVDLVLLGEGYTEAEIPKFHDDVRRLVEELFSYEPFKSRRNDFNVRAIDLTAAESGVSRPHAGKYRRNPLSTQYSIFDSERYALTMDNRVMRDVLSAVPYEFVSILINEKQYGGGGIFNWQATAAVGSEFSDYIFVHEFGHHFAGLGDEYYTSPVAYETGAIEHIEPWEPNVTALHDPENLKWSDLIDRRTPLPTPWEKKRYEEHALEILTRRTKLIDDKAPEEEFDRLFMEQRQVESEMLSSMEYSDRVGAFEGASYEPVGLYRPEIDCIMFTRNMGGFCSVCRRAIGNIIDLYSKPRQP